MACKRCLFMGMLAGGAAAAAAYQRKVRPVLRCWGSNSIEAADTFAGDDLVAQPNYSATLGIDIEAAPEHVWPWLMQMGDGRGGLYSYDFLDRLFGFIHGPSSREILPEYQRLTPGERIPLGRGDDFPVVAVDEGRSLVLGGTPAGFAWSWAFIIQDAGGGATRLISRSRARTPGGPGAKIGLLMLEPAAFLMTRRMLLGIKQRAERLAVERPASRAKEMAYSEA